MPAPTLPQMWISDSELPPDVLRLLISAVSEKLSIRNCKLLCAESREHINTLLQSMPAPTLREIDISCRELPPDVLRLLISAVSEKLSIRDCKLLCAESREHINTLLQSMPAPTLREIDISCRELPPDVLRLLISAVSEKLSIRYCKLLCAESREHINTLLQSMPAPTLREIHISFGESPPDVLRLLISAVSEKLFIRNCKLCAESREHINTLLQSMPAPTLPQMWISDSELPPDVLRLLISAVSEKLSIRNCKLLCAESREHINTLLQSMPAPTLREIDKACRELPPDVLLQSMPAPTLRLLISVVSEKLSIRNCKLLCEESRQHINTLLQSMPAPTLREIIISFRELPPDVLRLLISAVSENLCILDCKLLCAESREHINTLLQSMPAPTLREIDISFGELPPDVLRLLISAVSEKLSIRNCKLLCAESREHINTLLQSMPAPTLPQMWISDSELPPDVLRLLMSAVTEKLSIRDCKLLCAESREHINTLLQSMPAPTLT